MGFLASGLKYEEDISRFLPAQKKDSSSIFQQMMRQSEIAVILSSKDSSYTLNDEEAETLLDEVNEEITSKSLKLQSIQKEFSSSAAEEMMAFAYANAPYMLSAEEVLRADSLLHTPGYIANTLAENRKQLIVSQGMFMPILRHDPLHLYTSMMKRLSHQGNRFQVVDDKYLFTKDGKHALLLYRSPYGGSETQNNGVITDSLHNICQQFMVKHPQWRLSAVGAPTVAVGNARQIKTDSLLAASVAIVLIMLLLVWHYRRLHDILCIGGSLLFGFLFALAGLALIKESVSIIVLGIGSVIIGIAVNYPLHFLDHLREAKSVREALSEIVPPLLIGNITTVAAFLCLVFLDAEAMRDLGAFGALMLIGTILFVLVALPVYVKMPEGKGFPEIKCPSKLLSSLNNVVSGKAMKKVMIPLVVIITLVMGYFSLQTSFDSNLSHINYMTAEERADMSLLVGSGEELPNNKPFLQKKASYKKQIMWTAEMQREFTEACKANGFKEDAFADFLENINNAPEKKSYRQLSPLLSKITLPDTHSAASQLVDSLNSSFNWIGFVCSFVVFFFLWLSFGSIELAAMSFLPLAVAWLWILGAMQLLGIQFNIVNIILATFIFGQGDDYTIFITEGCMYEYTTGRKRLGSYRQSVLFSAILMFIGIGSLVFAAHPALRSLGAVTVIGMATVIIMAFYLPPLFFGWLTRHQQLQPLHIPSPLPYTFARIARSLFSIVFFVTFMFLGALPYTWLYFHVLPDNEHRRLHFHKLIMRTFRMLTQCLPGIRFHSINEVGEKFDKPAVVICNHQSHFDILSILQLHPKMLIVTNNWTWHNPFYGSVLHHGDFLPAADGIDKNLDKLQELYNKGYSIVIFPEGTRSADCEILRFHKGAFYLAHRLGADILPMYIHGQGYVLPKGDFMLRKGEMRIEVGKRISAAEWVKSSFTVDNGEINYEANAEVTAMTRRMQKHYKERYAEMCKCLETPSYIAPYRALQTRYTCNVTSMGE
jgi:1-acyl-sn-glycerol-3-phosphate acyltransferase